MRRADLPTERVLREIAEHGPAAWNRLTAEFPDKIVLAAYRRDDSRGLLDYGTWEGHPWLTPEGRSALHMFKMQAAINAVLERIEVLS